MSMPVNMKRRMILSESAIAGFALMPRFDITF
jgi:hypothetical protein